MKSKKVTFDEMFSALKGYISGDLDLSITGGPEAVEAMAALLTEELGLHLIGAVVNEPQNVGEGKIRLKATVILPRNLLQKRRRSRKNEQE